MRTGYNQITISTNALKTVLEARDIIPLHLVSRRFFNISRDSRLWKQLCFQDSKFKLWEKYKGRELRTPLPALQPRVDNLEQRISRSISRDDGGLLPHRKKTKNDRSFASWDPSSPGEKVNWYEEYTARHAQLSLNWLRRPVDIAKRPEKIMHEIRGMGLKYDGDEGIVVAPLDDGSVCLWNIGRRNELVPSAKSGRIMACSKPGLLINSAAEGTVASGKRAMPKADLGADGVVECVSVDRHRNKAYFAVDNALNEIDLETLQLSNLETYRHTICALSESSYPTPLTVGTTLGIHLHDPRLARNAPSGSQSLERLDPIATFPTRLQLCRDMSKSPYSCLDYAPLFDPGPLSILHQPSPDGPHDTSNGGIYVAGRFPSILAYDRRNFPKLRDTFHSGARLCSLALLDPVPGPSTPKSLIACGQYNGRGSLEIYPLPTSSTPETSSTVTPLNHNSYFRNRNSASSSKIFSLIPHGTRLLYSDGNCMLTWIERDGSTLVRRWPMNRKRTASPPSSQGIFPSSSTDSSSRRDFGRKLLSTGPNATDEILLWTGENIGLIGFRDAVLDTKAEEQEEETKSKDEERWEQYASQMRTALGRQANEVRFIPGFPHGRVF